MTMADKIVYYRKCRGWSQEDLAEQLGVSRQSVSKWESAMSQPELDKIIQLSKLFGITTDELLLEEAPAAPAHTPVPLPEQPPLRRLTLSEGQRYAELMHQTARRFALAVMACVLSVIPLLFLGALYEFRGAVSDKMAGGLGVAILLFMVAPAVAVFITGGIRLSKYEYISKEPFEAAPELTAWASAEKERLTPMFARHVVIGVVLCILAVVPMFLGAAVNMEEFYLAMALNVMFLLVSVAVYLFVSGGLYYGCFSQLLQQGDYSPEQKRLEHVRAAYWCVVTAFYLVVSFLTNRWDQTWIIWAVSGVIYAALSSILIAKRSKG